MRGREVLWFNRQHGDGELSGELVLVDECSMVPEEIGHDLIATGAKIVACGYPGQLPPVRGTQFFNRADFTLTAVHRQALDSPIIRQAHRVRTGGSYTADGPQFRVANDGADDDLRAADVVLCWTNTTRDRLNRQCRRARGYWQERPLAGEPLVCLKNGPLYCLYNGATYTLLRPFLSGAKDMVLEVDGKSQTIPRVTFRGLPSALAQDIEPTTTFDYGYALTVHKAQGSEWDSIVLLDEYRRAEHRERWLYTAITRAADRILVLRP
jgi:UvrD-like helicase C-terminal domain